MTPKQKRAALEKACEKAIEKRNEIGKMIEAHNAIIKQEKKEISKLNKERTEAINLIAMEFDVSPRMINGIINS